MRMKALARFMIFCATILVMAMGAMSQPINMDHHYVDGVLPLLNTMAPGKDKVYHLNQLSAMFTILDGNKALVYGNEAVQLARTIDDEDGLITALGRIAFIHAGSNDWPRSIIEVNEALQMVKPEDPRSIFFSNIMSINSHTQENVEEGLAWTRKAQDHPIFMRQPEENRWPTYMQLAMGYEALGQLDSASKYADTLKYFVGKYPHLSADLTNLSYNIFGRLALRKNDIPEAIRQFRFVDADLGIASAYSKEGIRDSVIFYARRSVGKFSASKNPNERQVAYKLLADAYDGVDPVKANEYLKQYVAVRESRFNGEKLKQLEKVQLDEQKRRAEVDRQEAAKKSRNMIMILLTILVVSLVFSVFLFRILKQKQRVNQELQGAYAKLEASKAQLVHAEKMASLGELTAGIAHEIQNPLNFVNNFSEINRDLIVEAFQAQERGDMDEVAVLLGDIRDNEGKIHQHGLRADAIVKSMLQHSRTSSGKKEPTDLAALADEYLKLAYHGMRAKDKDFNCALETDFDPDLPKVNVVTQDIGRVLLNLYNNAFQAVMERKKSGEEGYEPKVKVEIQRGSSVDPRSSILDPRSVTLRVTDNGPGIPEAIRDKIFQPFFTTKPTGQGTGLGLSLSYDIVTKGHGGEIKVESKAGEGSTFIVQFPV